VSGSTGNLQQAFIRARERFADAIVMKSLQTLHNEPCVDTTAVQRLRVQSDYALKIASKLSPTYQEGITPVEATQMIGAAIIAARQRSRPKALKTDIIDAKPLKSPEK